MMDVNVIWQMIYSALSEKQLARFERFMVVYTSLVEKELDKETAIDLLKGNLTPNDDTTFMDDSAWLIKTRMPMDVINELLAEVKDEQQ